MFTELLSFDHGVNYAIAPLIVPIALSLLGIGIGCLVHSKTKKTNGVSLGVIGRQRQVRKVFFSTDTTMSARDIFDIYRTRFQLEFVFRDAKQFTGLTHCQAKNKEALSFTFNASLTSVNVARAFTRQQGMELSVGSTKTLLHNAAMVDRFIAMSGKSPNMRLNNTDFKELLFYGVRAVA